nr:hypothetical protein [Chitinophagaceae bacterium]
MKKISKHSLLICTALVASFLAFAQNEPGGPKSIARENKIINATVNKKSLTAWDYLSELRQISLDDITADDKSVNFKSTIFGIHKWFDPGVNSSERYRKLAFERHFEPNLDVKYEGKFNPINAGIGFNYSFVNRNDATENLKLNHNLALDAQSAKLDNELSDVVFDTLLVLAKARYPSDNAGRHAELQRMLDLIQSFVTSGDIQVLDKEPAILIKIRNAFTTGLKSQRISLLAAYQEIEKDVDRIAQEISRGWNVVFTPTFTYAFNQGRSQGMEFAFKGLNGYRIFKNEKKTSQLILQASFKIGDDTIVAKSRMDRRQITDEIGFNQVFLLTKAGEGEDDSDRKPAGEFSITGGYNRILNGLATEEKAGQPTLTARLGILIGKDSWLVVPLDYNFGVKR